MKRSRPARRTQSSAAWSAPSAHREYVAQQVVVGRVAIGGSTAPAHAPSQEAERGYITSIAASDAARCRPAEPRKRKTIAVRPTRRAVEQLEPAVRGRGARHRPSPSPPPPSRPMQSSAGQPPPGPRPHQARRARQFHSSYPAVDHESKGRDRSRVRAPSSCSVTGSRRSTSYSAVQRSMSHPASLTAPTLERWVPVGLVACRCSARSTRSAVPSPLHSLLKPDLDLASIGSASRSFEPHRSAREPPRWSSLTSRTEPRRRRAG